MGEKNDKKYVTVSLNTAILLIIIFILAIALTILLIYNRSLREDVLTSNTIDQNGSDSQGLSNTNALNNNASTNNILGNNTLSNNSNSNTTSNVNSTPKALDINSDQIKKLYNYVLKYDTTDNGSSWDVDGNTNPTSFYKETKVSYDNLSNDEKIFAVLQSYGESGVKNIPLGNLRNVITVPDEYVEYYSTSNVKVYENVSETAKKIFGKNSDINWRSYEGIGELEYKNNNYYSYAIQAGGLGLTNKAYSKIIRAEQVGNNIYIYDNYIWYDEYDSLVNGDSYDYLYKSAGKVSLVAKEKSVSSNVDGDALIAKYKDKLYTYKHTFQKASDGSYYWVSTEPVK